MMDAFTNGFTNLFHFMATIACGVLIMAWWGDIQDRRERKRRAK